MARTRVRSQLVHAMPGRGAGVRAASPPSIRSSSLIWTAAAAVAAGVTSPHMATSHIKPQLVGSLVGRGVAWRGVAGLGGVASGSHRNTRLVTRLMHCSSGPAALLLLLHREESPVAGAAAWGLSLGSQMRPTGRHARALALALALLRVALSQLGSGAGENRAGVWLG